MTDILVKCERAYRVLIEKGILSEAAEHISRYAMAEKYCIVTDRNVAELYLSPLRDAIKPLSAELAEVVIEPGEDNKTLSSVEKILCTLAQNHFTRSDCIIALGGGIVGDIAGFAASVYMRGIRFVQIPTTLLAAIDSSVGGKTGVNLGGLKNQVGAFWQPSLVLCDPDTFSTLPETELRNGVAEAIKYAAICDAGLADSLGGDICRVVARCVEIKSEIVSRDERDLGERMLLNFGHTFGHAIEYASRGKIPHGAAVGMGMVLAAELAERISFCRQGTKERIVALLNTYGLAVSSEYSKKTLYEAIKNDKKRDGETVTLVLPRDFGSCELYRISMEELEKLMKA